MTKWKHLHNNDKIKIVDSRFNGNERMVTLDSRFHGDRFRGDRNDKKIINGDTGFPFTREQVSR